jgi:hypothetical protein
MNILHFLCQHRWLWEVAMAGGVIYTLIVEIGFPFLVWNPRMRGPMILGAIFLHAGIALFMSLCTFSLIMVALVTAFFPSETIRRLVSQLFSGAASFRLLFTNKSARQMRAASLVHAFDLGEQVELIESAHVVPTESSERLETGITTRPAAAQEKSSVMELIDAKGKVYSGYALFVRLVRSMRSFWPLALLTWMPGVGNLGQSFFPEKGRQFLKPAKARKEAVA